MRERTILWLLSWCWLGIFTGTCLVLTGCPWMDTVAVESDTAAALKIRAAVAEALAEAEAKGFTPAQAEALATEKVEKAKAELKAELAAGRLKAGAKGLTGDVGGAIAEIGGQLLVAYIAYRGAKPIAQAGIAAVRRRRKIAGTPVVT